MNKENKISQLLSKLIASGLERWIRIRCKRIGSLYIKLDSSTSDIFKGRIKGLNLRASNIVFNEIALNKVELKSGIIQLNLRSLRNNNEQLISNNFIISGSISMNSKELSDTIRSKNWNWISDILAKELLYDKPITRLKFTNNKLELQVKSPKETNGISHHFFLSAIGGTINLSKGNLKQGFSLPMDPNINIKEAKINKDLIHIECDALVTP